MIDEAGDTTMHEELASACLEAHDILATQAGKTGHATITVERITVHKPRTQLERDWDTCKVELDQSTFGAK